MVKVVSACVGGDRVNFTKMMCCEMSPDPFSYSSHANLYLSLALFTDGMKVKTENSV